MYMDTERKGKRNAVEICYAMIHTMTTFGLILYLFLMETLDRNNRIVLSRHRNLLCFLFMHMNTPLIWNLVIGSGKTNKLRGHGDVLYVLWYECVSFMTSYGIGLRCCC